ncbi:imidazoleglycerol-phosphate dehydratase HisB [Peptococcus simiae]|uniref:imidazoleglycerol-phosphate dehydratase HisB n=1 Tax=Peptococcus simiae TaxID=1643805 RepID=UPI003980AADD
MMSIERRRHTKETDIHLVLELDGNGHTNIDTGIGFFDHMLTALAVHAGWDLTLYCNGDLEVCGHHTVEDCGIVLGDALHQALGTKTGLVRYGHAYIPMDEALVRCVVDVSGRPYLAFDATFTAPAVGQLDTQLVEEFFRAFAMHAGITLHIAVLSGKNDHHCIEAMFKSVAHAMRKALMKRDGVLSTKGVFHA